MYAAWVLIEAQSRPHVTTNFLQLFSLYRLGLSRSGWRQQAKLNAAQKSFARGGGSAAPVSECGIGVELVLNANDGRVFLSWVDRDRGAWRAGAHKDNCLLKVGNTFVSDVTHCATPAGGRKITYDEALDRVTKLLKGKKGSHVQVQVGIYYCKKTKYFTKTVDVERK